MKRYLVGILVLLAAAACSNKRVNQDCTFNEDCAEGYRCSNNLCVDIYHPGILPPQGSVK